MIETRELAAKMLKQIVEIHSGIKRKIQTQ